MANFDDFKLAIEAMSGGKNTVLFDDVGMPSVMVPFPKLKLSELIEKGTENAHPAFRVNGVEKKVVYVSKFQNVVINGRGYSLPMRDPAVNVTFETALKYCRSKGNGWGLMPYSLWCAIALWCKKNNFLPHGNNNYGRDITYTHEKGIEATKDGGHNNDTAHTLTGSGPATWYHNGQPDGIADLNGNVWEWCAGMRLKAGEIQIIADANCMDPEESLLDGSTGWKGIDKDGGLTDPGVGSNLKWDRQSATASGGLKLTTDAITATDDTAYYGKYESMTLGGDVALGAPELAKALLLYPDDPEKDVYGGDYHWARLTEERLPICGGGWNSGAHAGVFDVDLYSLRSYSSAGIGFRSAYVDL